MSALALQLIRENIAAHARGEDATTLDLGNCGMTEVPAEIHECRGLTTLILSSDWSEYDPATKKWEQKTSQNTGEPNTLKSLPPTHANLLSLQKIVLNHTQVSDLSPLVGLLNLQQLICNSTQVSDLSPLAGLINLQILYCDSTQVSDLSPLAGLLNLQLLYCSYTQVSDLSPLAGLLNLQLLYCSYTQVSDLSPLAGLLNLQELSCSSTQVSDLSPLAGLLKLQLLYCSSTQVSDLSPLAGLLNLQLLWCYSTQVSDLSPLARLINLQELWCNSTQMSDLSPLAGLLHLQQLSCGSTQVSDLSPLAGLLHLQLLRCNSTQVSDLSPLAGLLNLQHLHCGSMQVSDLSPLAGLLNLQHLHCGSMQVSDLSPLAGLLNLQELYCDSTQVSDLSPLAGLLNLQQLICFSTQVSDLSPLAGLLNLKELWCDSTPVSDLSPLAGLLNLQKLTCDSTQVSDLSPLAGLLNLKELTCDRTQVLDLWPLVGLLNLQYLSCYSTQVSDLSPLAGLLNLQQLRCFSKQMSDLSPLAGLLNLKELWCDSTQVADLSPLAGLLNLQTLYCNSTQVSDLSPLLPWIEKGIPVNWAQPNFEKEIFVRNCPLIIPPVEFAQDSPQVVRDYFEELGDDGQKLNEVKVIFLGEASAGKTSIVKRLMGEAFNSKESQTHGIRIRKAPFVMDDGDTVTAHLWDFGGQEVMHATHQFFLSQRSVYVLLLNSRNDDQAEKWLKHAASFGGRSPVLVVLNKIDENPSFEVNRKTLQEKYPQIRAFFRVSAQTEAGMDDFKEALRREIDRADTRRTPFPEHWLAVKSHFADMKADYIESAEYQQVCEAKGVTRQFSQDVLLKFLHDLGVVINFDQLKNFDTQILNPLWLTNGVYRIINSAKVADEGGILHEADFDAVINDPRYRKEGNTTDRVYHFPKGKLQYIVRVMQEFELCFVLPDARTYVVPQLLPVQEPDFKAEGAMVRFVIHFPEFLPDSVFPRLMVKLHTFIADGSTAFTPSGNTPFTALDISKGVNALHPDRVNAVLPTSMWRTGMVLHKPNIFNALARVRWDKEDQKILVDVCGEDRRKLLSFIRETVREIVDTFTNLKYSELVPIPESKEFLDYEGLVEAEKAKEKEVFVWQVKKKLAVADLLDGVEEPAMRDEVEQLPVRAFVSYAHADLEYLKELKTALAPLMRLQKLSIWDDRDINAGDEWEQVLFQQLEECDIVLCLVSADFVDSDFCYKKEFGAALEAHRKGEKTIVPIMLRQTDWQDLPLAEIQGSPGEWITSAKNKDEAWTKVSESLRPALDKAKHRKKALLDQRRER